MKKIEVYDGNELYYQPVPYPTNNPRCAFVGVNNMGQDIYVPIDHNLLSRHMMLLGGIGTGKTNTFNQIIRQLRHTMTQEDIMIIFDTKGDFYKEFYQPGDIVISNDNTATGPNGPDYWNIFNEIERDDHMEENIVEIAKSLFHQKLEKHLNPSFQMQPRIYSREFLLILPEIRIYIQVITLFAPSSIAHQQLKSESY